jgi:hypothetical protein
VAVGNGDKTSKGGRRVAHILLAHTKRLAGNILSGSQYYIVQLPICYHLLPSAAHMLPDSGHSYSISLGTSYLLSTGITLETDDSDIPKPGGGGWLDALWAARRPAKSRRTSLRIPSQLISPQNIQIVAVKPQNPSSNLNPSPSHSRSRSPNPNTNPSRN